MAHAVVVPVVGGNPLSRQRPTAMARHGNLSLNYSDGSSRVTSGSARAALSVLGWASKTLLSSPLGHRWAGRKGAAGVALPLAADHDVRDPQAYRAPPSRRSGRVAGALAGLNRVLGPGLSRLSAPYRGAG